jgi:PAS domain S-box-containing protein
MSSYASEIECILEHAPVLIWRSGRDGRCDYFNGAWLRFTGRTLEQEVGEGWVEAVHPDDRDRCVRSYLAHFQRREPFEMQYRLRRHDGTYRWILDRGAPFSRASDGFAGFIGGCIDIQDRMAAEIDDRNQTAAKLRESERQAIAANRAKDEFLAMLGHELRNPLAPIQTALQLMRMRGHQAPEISVIERQTGHLVRLVDDLLDVSRITRGKVELRKDRIQLRSVVLAGAEMASPLLEQRHQRLDIDVPVEGLAVLGDQGRLAQVVANLLTNAAKYSEPATRITVSGDRSGQLVRLRVRDQGMGIPSDLVARIFDTFVQFPQALDRSLGGLGLGLTIVRSLVELHGGTVSVHSDGPGKGSEFAIELPLAPEVADRPPHESTSVGGIAPISTISGSNARRGRILVVDDNLDGAATIGEALADVGYEVAIAHDGPSALAIAGPFKPDIGLLDIGLPVMDGYELARRLRQGAGVPPDLRLVAITGYGLDTDRQLSREAGFDAHLVKPVSLEDLLESISALPLRPSAAQLKE